MPGKGMPKGSKGTPGGTMALSISGPGSGSISGPPSSEGSQNPTLPLVPIMVENPDGSMAEGVPPGYKEKEPPRSPRGSFGGDGLWGPLDAAGVQEELTLLHQRHEYLFAVLLMLQFLAEIVFATVYVFHVDNTIRELRTVYMYINVSDYSLRFWFWFLFAFEMVVAVVYYTIGILALKTNRPSYYKLFTSCCLMGIVCQVMMAYMNKFNLLIFFMRLLSYIYSRFLRSLALHMQLLPNANANIDI